MSSGSDDLLGTPELVHEAPTVDQIRRASLTVAYHAHNPKDCATLLDMLGLDPTEATA